MLELSIAVFLGVMVTLTAFDVYVHAFRLSNQLATWADAQDRIQFLSFFLRTKIQSTGDKSCLFSSINTHESVIKTIHQAGADQLVITECVYANHQWQYLPLDFYINDSHRIHHDKSIIYSLYYKIGDSPGEELISDVSNFRVSLVNSGAHIQYMLTSSIDYHFHQIGFVDAAVRKI